SYFTLSDDSSTKSEQIEKLNGFYNVVPETKNQGQVRSTTELISAKILMIEKDIATYQVTYTTGKEKDKQEITTGFAVPFGEKDGAYFISGLPWYVRLTDTKATGFDSSDSVTLVDDTETNQKTKEKRDEFLTLFFTNYTSNQENLDLIADDLLSLENTTFKSLDYSYYTKDGKTITAYAQVTFEIAGNTHSENFTLTLRKKDQSYYVQRLSHTISKNYAQSHTENTGETK
ncbi:conjugal transfer protein, partial [Streptococcus agalactiae]|nr:conjugal transfer protein [Streptococcus agalactiae]